MTKSTLETTHQQRLLVCGWIDQVKGEVARGMPVLAQDGSMVGVVAAVIQCGATQTISHILLGQTPPSAVYRLIPIDLLDKLAEECIWLHTSREQVAALPVHRSDY